MKAGKAEGAFCPRKAGKVVSAANRRGPRRAGKGLLAPFLALLLAAPAVAGWHEEAAPRDLQRLGQLSQSRSDGLADAARGNPKFYAAAKSILNAGTVPAAEGSITGTWRCRTMKLGGVTPSIVYDWFRCRISPYRGVLLFEKLGGTTRTAGILYPDGGSFVYLGSQSVTAYGPPETRHFYSGRHSPVGAEATPDDQIGRLSKTYDGRLRLEMPYPVQESVFDVIELKR